MWFAAIHMKASNRLLLPESEEKERKSGEASWTQDSMATEALVVGWHCKVMSGQMTSSLKLNGTRT